MVSRAYLKMEEVFAGLSYRSVPVNGASRSAAPPGGASQALLSRGFTVTGIDPAAMHPTVLGNPHFTHIRKRGHEVRRREFRKTRWLVADINLSRPHLCINTVESIVTHPRSMSAVCY